MMPGRDSKLFLIGTRSSSHSCLINQLSLQVNGFAAGFATTGDKERQAAVSNFFDIITGSHSYATGGNNDGEAWGAPYQLGSTIAGVRHPLLLIIPKQCIVYCCQPQLY